MDDEENSQVECQDCGWIGDAIELVAKDEQSWIFDRCPNCGSADIEDFE